MNWRSESTRATMERGPPILRSSRCARQQSACVVLSAVARIFPANSLALFWRVNVGYSFATLSIVMAEIHAAVGASALDNVSIHAPLPPTLLPMHRYALGPNGWHPSLPQMTPEGPGHLNFEPLAPIRLQVRVHALRPLPVVAIMADELPVSGGPAERLDLAIEARVLVNLALAAIRHAHEHHGIRNRQGPANRTPARIAGTRCRGGTRRAGSGRSAPSG